ncbi:hypothetical protein HY522_07755 [bacterium]|nr:hypothetical protein [bacterium]
MSIDRFHDTETEIRAAFSRDLKVLRAAGFQVRILIRQTTFVRAVVSNRSGDQIRIEWACDSAFRFFPLEVKPALGRVLSPFDLATNKTLAMAGRLKIRDWLDMILCHKRLQPLGLLAYAACGKDPGFSPEGIVEYAARCSRYTAVELATLRFRSTPPRLDALHKQWRAAVEQARDFLEILPPDHAGQCVMEGARLFRGTPRECRKALAAGRLMFRPGRLDAIVGVPQPAHVYPDPLDIDTPS